MLILVVLLIASSATSALSITVTRSKLFGWFRGLFKQGLLHELVNCPYCVSHWFGLLAALWMAPSDLATFVFYWFAIVGVAAIVTGLISRLLLWSELKEAELESQLLDARNGLTALDEKLASCEVQLFALRGENEELREALVELTAEAGE